MDLFVTGAIDNQLVNKVVKKILRCADDKILVYVNSEGGDPRGGFAIYEALRHSGKKILTVAVKDVYSSAMIVYLAGETRYATDYSHFLIHEIYHPEPGENATATDYKRSHDELEYESTLLFQLICNNSKLTIAKVKKQVAESWQRDWYFEVEVARRWGLVTHMGYPERPAVLTARPTKKVQQKP